MAKIDPSDVSLIERKMVVSCAGCSDEFTCLVVALRNVDSLREKGLMSFGFNKVRVEGMRRRYRVQLRNCEGEVTFYWKDNVISDLDVVCPRMEP